MQNFRQRLGNRGYGNFGLNAMVQVPGVNSPVGSGTEIQWLTFKDFTGLSGVNAREDTLPPFSPDALDVYVTPNDRLTVVPGTVLSESLAGHSPSRVALHTSLDYTSDLVFFDAPRIGIKHVGATQWYDVELPTGRPYSWANFGGTLLFSNGNRGMYAREQGKTTVELVEGAPAARAYASFAGRVFAAHAVVGGNLEPLGIAWSAASSDYHDWSSFNDNNASTGAGFELLIDEMAAGDAIIALRPMGLDFMAVFLRNSIWIGSVTGDLLRPADFRPRVPGVGAINAECCKTTRFGVVFLAEGPGVYLFNGNAAELISDEITPFLSELSRTELAGCTAEYNPLNKCYYLFTSIGTFVYDFERKRWHRRSLVAQGAVIFSTQFPATTWTEISGSWGAQGAQWQDLKPEQSDDLKFYFLGESSLEVEDRESFFVFGTRMNPYWEFPLTEGQYSNQLVTTKRVLLNVEAPGSGQLSLFLPDIEGTYVAKRLVNIPALDSGTVATMLEETGRGAGVRLVFKIGKPSITRMQIGLILRGPRIEDQAQESIGLTDSGLNFDDYYTDFSNNELLASPSDWALLGGSIDQVSLVVVADASSRSGRVLRLHSIGADTAVAAFWADVGSLIDASVASRFKTTNVAIFQPTVLLRLANRVTQDYYAVFLNQGLGKLQLVRGSVGATPAQQLITSVDFMPVNNTWYGVRLEAVGTALSVKLWQWDENVEDFGESLALTLAATDANFTAGNVGMGLYASGGNSSYLEFFSVRLGGGPAPLEPVLADWIIPPTGYHVRITGLPDGYRALVDGEEFLQEDGILYLDQPVAPTSIQFLRGDGSALNTIAAPTNRRSYIAAPSFD